MAHIKRKLPQGRLKMFKAKRLISIVLFISFMFSPTSSYSQEGPAKYVPMGTRVSIDSMCFSVPAAVKIKLDLQYCKKEAELEFAKKKELYISEQKLKSKLIEIQSEATDNKMRFTISEQHKQIEFLNDKIKEIDKPTPWYKNNMLWLSTGMFIGAGTIIGSAYLLSSIK